MIDVDAPYWQAFSDYNVRHVVSVSSGVPSALAALLVLDRYGADNVDLIFADTLAEDADNYRFLADLERMTGKQITRLVDGRTPLDIMLEQDVIFTPAFAPCTRILKLELIMDYVAALQRDGHTIVMHIGYDLKDLRKNRADATTRNWIKNGCIPSYPIIDARITDTQSEIKRRGLIPPSSYELGFPHANCLAQGGCVKFGQKDMVKILEYFPDRYALRERVELQIRHKQALFHIVNALVVACYVGLSFTPEDCDMVLYTHVRESNREIQLTLKELRERYQAARQVGGMQLRMFELEADLAGCSVECAVTDPGNFENVA